jgi:hypothetical protein
MLSPVPMELSSKSRARVAVVAIITIGAAFHA